MKAPDFWDRKTSGALPTLLRPAGCLVAWAAALRLKSTKPEKASVPVICVGNLVAGGAGKTPVAYDIAKRLRGASVDVHIVSRGYGGTEIGPLLVEAGLHDAARVGDEPLLLTHAAPVWVADDRRQGVRAAVNAGAEAIIFDDGFQDPSVHKDLSLLVVDGDYGFGNGRVMPAGPLRETIATGLKRADAVVLMGPDNADIMWSLRRKGFGDLPLLRASLQPKNGAAFKDKKVFAFAGIARPEKFFTTLTATGAKIEGTCAFDDHHQFTPDELNKLGDMAGSGLTVVTTAKDYQRLPADMRARVEVLEVELQWKDEAAIDALLKREDAHG